MSTAPVVTIGGSAGALEPLVALVAHLPADLPAAVLVVVHVSPDHPSHLPDILSRSGPLPARHARHGDLVEAGRIYVAPPDHHLLLAHDHLRLSRGPKENRSRPSIDVLMRSAAYTRGADVIGVLLSGMLDDGTSGLWTVKRAGGQALVQHPEDAAFPSMPLSAIRAVSVDAILPTGKLAPELTRLVTTPPHPRKRSDMNDEDRRRLELEVGIADGGNAFESGLLDHGTPSTFTCPECHGVLVGVREGPVTRFRCHTGHAYTAQTLLSELRGSIEAGLWNAVRALDEDVMLLEHLGRHFEEADQPELARAYREEAREAKERARGVRQSALRAGQIGHDRRPALTRDPRHGERTAAHELE
ncbi:chemotaxis protein CheB [Deinococcus pimensis]|uniref:chemotaxis protein CheB n=1 Tax=Deinococcus pimensis TaxID=309888 RepID=UPI0004828DC9|nr:chemotaxis protein CheB [Deinococcus pimensis]